ncbi:MAG: VOC family protein [Saprospiraceae bacterium]|nr:VOC family protein [Saprospiraceae bacterium]
MPKIGENNNRMMPICLVPDAEKFMTFLKELFGAEELMRVPAENGTIQHAQMRIDDSVLMLGEATKEFGAHTCMMYIYVDDTDATFKQAIDMGCKSVMEPYEEAYGARSAGFEDAFGNTWWLATLH